MSFLVEVVGHLACTTRRGASAWRTGSERFEYTRIRFGVGCAAPRAAAHPTRAAPPPRHDDAVLSCWRAASAGAADAWKRAARDWPPQSRPWVAPPSLGNPCAERHFDCRGACPAQAPRRKSLAGLHLEGGDNDDGSGSGGGDRDSRVAQARRLLGALGQRSDGQYK
eukprot:scaffold2257_cov291-Prasinococcus_capsulatus_cf.AAC.1